MKKENAESFWHRIRFKYELSFINEGTSEEVWSFRPSQLSTLVTLAVFAFFLIAVTASIIIRTPICNHLPDYLDMEVRREIMQNALWVNSLERMIEIQSFYLDNVAGIIPGAMPLDSIRQIDSLTSSDVNYEIPRSKEETRPMKDYEEEERYSLSVLTDPGEVPTEGVFLYKLVNGVVASHYETDTYHYGVDLTATPKGSILTTLDDTAIYIGFDPNHGNVIQLQHKNGFILVYERSELLLKEVGDHVVAGEAIASIGNTEELSAEPHLHFELWYKGNPMNPEGYTTF